MIARSKLQNFGKRRWEDVRGSWLDNIPRFPGLGASPDPGLESLLQLQRIPENYERFPDISGIRMNVLWEAVFLFHKCAHANLAAQRLGDQGMHSWCLFNAYHAGYLGAKGIMALLGVALANIGGQVVIDVCPEPLKPVKKRISSIVTPQFQEFLIVKLGEIDQVGLWELFQRVVNMSTAECWDDALLRELIALAPRRITPPRNHFLYKAKYWPLGDLVADVKPPDVSVLFGEDLDVDGKDFLLRLSFSVYRIFEQLMSDLADNSTVIKDQFAGSRFLATSDLPELGCYRDFLSRIEAPVGGLQ
jgi:hypothetical protein